VICKLGVVEPTAEIPIPQAFPSDLETLPVQCGKANSRFLTDCYLVLDALLSARCLKIGQHG